MKIVLLTLLVSAITAFFLGLLLGIFKKIFHVEVDPTVSKIRECLPGANCGGCGYPGCDGFATACAKGEASVEGCTAGGAEVISKIASIMGTTAEVVQKATFVGCRGTKDVAIARGIYTGIKTCSAAKQAINGTKFCNWACIGFGDCENSCSFKGLKIGSDGLPHVNHSVCTGCGSCVKVCPQGILKVLEVGKSFVKVQCSNKSPVKAQILKFCKNGCVKCGKCEKLCETGAIKLENNIPVVDSKKCNACGKCVEGCPTKVLILN